MTLLKLTDKARVKGLIDAGEAAATSSYDTPLQRIIDGISAEVERYLDRKLNLEARTEQYSPRAFDRTIALSAFPVAASPALVVKQATDRDFTAATATAAADYFLDLPTGLITFDDGLSGGPGSVQVVYTGGIATQAGSDAHLPALETAYPDIVLAATLWSKLVFESKNRLGTGSKGGKGFFLATAGVGYPPPEVKQLLAAHRRIRISG